MREISRRRFLQGSLALAGVGLLSGCGRLPFQTQLTPKVPRVGFLSPGPPGATGPAIEAWRDGLHDLGWVDGQNVAIEARYADNKLERYPDLAAELVAAHLDVIFTGAGTPAIRALENATSTVPIVMVSSTDVVDEGLVSTNSLPKFLSMTSTKAYYGLASGGLQPDLRAGKNI